MEETARGLETNEFLALLAEENSMAMLKENITLLLPTDKAVEEYEDFLAQQNGLGKRGCTSTSVMSLFKLLLAGNISGISGFPEYSTPDSGKKQKNSPPGKGK